MNIEEVKQYWDRQPCNIKHSKKEIGTKEYFEEVRFKKLFVEPHILEFTNFSQYKNKNVLEVGCGIGTAAYLFVNNGAKYTGIDLSPNSVSLTRQHLSYANNDNVPTVFEWDIEKQLDSKYEDCFDLVYSFGVLHHTPDIDYALMNIYDVLKKDGTFKLMLYAENSWKNAMIHAGLDQYEAQNGCPIANVYTNESITELLESHGFKGIQIQQDHIFKYKIDKYKNGEYEEEEWFAHMSTEMKEALNKKMGWHLCITCTK